MKHSFRQSKRIVILALLLGGVFLVGLIIAGLWWSKNRDTEAPPRVAVFESVPSDTAAYFYGMRLPALLPSSVFALAQRQEYLEEVLDVSFADLRFMYNHSEFVIDQEGHIAVGYSTLSAGELEQFKKSAVALLALGFPNQVNRFLPDGTIATEFIADPEDFVTSTSTVSGLEVTTITNNDKSLYYTTDSSKLVFSDNLEFLKSIYMSEGSIDIAELSKKCPDSGVVSFYLDQDFAASLGITQMMLGNPDSDGLFFGCI